MVTSTYKFNGDPFSYQEGGIYHRVQLYFPAPPDWNGPTKGGDTKTAMWETFANPEQIQLRYPVRAQTVQTVGGVYFDSYGSGLPTGTISGTFGFGKDKRGKSGIDRLKELKNLYNWWLETTVSLPKGNDSMLIIQSDGVYFYVFWGDLEISRAKSTPFLVNYTLSFTATKDDRNQWASREYRPPIGPAPIDGGTPPDAPNSTPH